MKLRFVLSTLTLVVASASVAADAHGPEYKIGLINWDTAVFLDPTVQQTFLASIEDPGAPSFVGGQIIQEVYDSIQNQQNYASLNSFVKAVDAADHKVSLMYGNSGWGGDISYVVNAIDTILDFIGSYPHALTYNKFYEDASGTLTQSLDIAIDLEPCTNGNAATYASALAQCRTKIDQFNANTAHPIKATMTLLAPRTAAQILQNAGQLAGAVDSVDCFMTQAYRNMACTKDDCTSASCSTCFTDTPSQVDGFLLWADFAMKEIAQTPPPATTGIILETARADAGGGNLAACWEVSFGAARIYDNNGAAHNPISNRTSYMQQCMDTAWAAIKTNYAVTGTNSIINAEAAFVVHDWSWVTCFKTGKPLAGSTCDPCSSCSDTSHCIPAYAAQGEPGDVNHDGVVDVDDYLLLGVLLELCREDVNTDGAIDVFDLLNVISAWGPCL